jgi:hypothetical protein
MRLRYDARAGRQQRKCFHHTDGDLTEVLENERRQHHNIPDRVMLLHDYPITTFCSHWLKLLYHDSVSDSQELLIAPFGSNAHVVCRAGELNYPVRLFSIVTPENPETEESSKHSGWFPFKGVDSRHPFFAFGSHMYTGRFSL